MHMINFVQILCGRNVFVMGPLCVVIVFRPLQSKT